MSDVCDTCAFLHNGHFREMVKNLKIITARLEIKVELQLNEIRLKIQNYSGKSKYSGMPE